MAAEGQHRARLVVQGDAKSAIREHNQLVTQQTKLERELAKANLELAKQAQGLTKNELAARKAAAAEQRLAQQQGAVAQSAHRAAEAERMVAQQRAAQQRAALAQGQLDSRATSLAQERQLIEATTKLDEDGVRKRIAAIERHRDAQVAAVRSRLSSASGELETLKVFDDERDVMHRANLDRIQVESRFREQQTRQAAQLRAQQQASVRQASAGAGAAMLGLAGTAVVVGTAVDAGMTRLNAFSNVARNLPFSIDKARDSSLGMVDDFTLMRLSVQANRLGVAKSSEDFAKLADMATKLGLSVGRDPVDALERLTLGIGKQEQEILDELGVIVRATEAHKIWAKAHHTTVAAMSDLEKQMAFNELAMERAAAKAEQVSVAVDGGGGAWARMKIRVTNLLDHSVLPALGVAVESTMDSVSSLANALTLGALGMSEAERAALKLGGTTKRNTEALAENLKRIREFTGTTEDALTPMQKFNNKLAEQIGLWGELEAAPGVDKLARELAAGLAGVNKQADKLNKAAFFQASTAADIGAQVHQLDLEVTYLSNVRGEEERIEMLTQRRVALLMEEAALRGDILGVIELQRAEELRVMDQQTRRPSGGRKRKGPSQHDLIFGELGRQAGFRAMDRGAQNDRETFASEFALASSTQEMERAANMMPRMSEEELERIRAHEQAKSEILLSSRLRTIESMRESGVDPVQLIDAEEQARVSHLEFLERNTDDLIEKDRLRDQIEAEHHKARLDRMREEEAARARHRQKVVAITSAMVDATGSVMSGGLALARDVSAASRKSEEEKARFAQRSMAIEAFGIGTLETIKAAAAFASLNIPQGIAHTAAAGLAFAKGTLLATGQIGPNSASARDARAAAGGANASPRAIERGGAGDPSEIPTSRDSRPPAPGKKTGGFSVGVINIHSLKPSKEIARDLREELRLLDIEETG